MLANNAVIDHFEQICGLEGDFPVMQLIAGYY